MSSSHGEQFCEMIVSTPNRSKNCQDCRPSSILQPYLLYLHPNMASYIIEATIRDANIVSTEFSCCSQFFLLGVEVPLPPTAGLTITILLHQHSFDTAFLQHTTHDMHTLYRKTHIYKYQFFIRLYPSSPLWLLSTSVSGRFFYTVKSNNTDESITWSPA